MKPLLILALIPLFMLCQAGPQKKGERRFVPQRYYQLSELQQVDIKVGGHAFKAFVMDTDRKRSEGMMFFQTTDFKEKECMVFAFPDEDYRSFWMANCNFNLDILYVAANKRVVRATTMKAQDRTGVPSNRPAMYAIEFLPGAIKKYGFKAGTLVEFPKSLVAKD